MKLRRTPTVKTSTPVAHKPVSCSGCGRTFSSASAHQVAHAAGRCLPDHVIESVLAPVDGVWCVRGAS